MDPDSLRHSTAPKHFLWHHAALEKNSKASEIVCKLPRVAEACLTKFDVVENYRLFSLPTVNAFHTLAAIYSQHVFEWQERGRDVMRAPNDAHAAYRHISGRIFHVIFHDVLFIGFTLSRYYIRKNFLSSSRFENESTLFSILQLNRRKVKKFMAEATL